MEYRPVVRVKRRRDGRTARRGPTGATRAGRFHRTGVFSPPRVTAVPVQRTLLSGPPDPLLSNHLTELRRAVSPSLSSTSVSSHHLATHRTLTPPAAALTRPTTDAGHWQLPVARRYSRPGAAAAHRPPLARPALAWGTAAARARVEQPADRRRRAQPAEAPAEMADWGNVPPLGAGRGPVHCHRTRATATSCRDRLLPSCWTSVALSRGRARTLRPIAHGDCAGATSAQLNGHKYPVTRDFAQREPAPDNNRVPAT